MGWVYIKGIRNGSLWNGSEEGWKGSSEKDLEKEEGKFVFNVSRLFFADSKVKVGSFSPKWGFEPKMIFLM